MRPTMIMKWTMFRAEAAERHGEDDRRREDLQRVVEHPERQAGPDEDLVDGRTVTPLHEAQGRQDPRPAPEARRERAADEDADGRQPHDDDGDDAVLVGDLVVDDEEERAERRLVERRPGEPPRHDVAGREIILGLADVLGERQARDDDDGEVGEDDEVVGEEDAGRTHHSVPFTYFWPSMRSRTSSASRQYSRTRTWSSR